MLKKKSDCISSDLTVNSPSGTIVNDANCDMKLEEPVVPKLSENTLICPTFSNLRFKDWSLEKEDLDTTNNELGWKNRPQTHNDDLAFDVEAALNDNDDDGLMFAGANELEVGDDGDGEDQALSLCKMNGVSGVHVKAPWDHLARVPSEYSYFDFGRLGTWAGPKHWKIKPVSRVVATDKDDKRKLKKDKEKLAFDEMDVEKKRICSIVRQAMSEPKRAVKLQNKTMEKWTEERYLLPEDFHYSGKSFVRLEFMKKLTVVPKETAQSQSVDDSIADYDFDNPNDTQNFCPEIPAANSNDYQDEEGAARMESENILPSQNDDEEEEDALGLIAAPNRVEKIQIGYAKLAKKIDMRKLKAAEWSILQDSSTLDDGNKENVTGLDNDSVNPVTRGKLYFSEMYSALKKPNFLPQKMSDSLSVPLAFVTLLHLCNEHGLELCSHESLNDFDILNV